MITRIVKMTFAVGKVREFEQIFEQTVAMIRKSEGCRSVRLMQDLNDPDTYFTISQWDSVEKLNTYRNSDLFKRTWADVKPLFVSKAQAWSLDERFMTR